MKSPLHFQSLTSENINIRNSNFCADTLDLFQKRRSGHMSKWLYSTPQFSGDKACGADVRQRVIEDAKNGSPYYVFLHEKAIIQRALPAVHPLFDRPSRLIDLGPGSLEALEQKVFPLLAANGRTIVGYTGVDVCKKTLDAASNAVKAKFKTIQATSLNKNFIDDEFSYGRPIPLEMAMLFGLTLFNLDIDPRVPDLPQKALQESLEKIRSHFSSEQRYLLITQDINQDVNTLRAAYFAISPYFLCLPHRMQRDLFIEGYFNPDGFSVGVDYFENTKALSVCFIAQEDMHFTIETESCQIQAGERFYFNNAYKFDIETFLGAAAAAGMRPLQTIQEDSNHCILHILKCV